MAEIYISSFALWFRPFAPSVPTNSALPAIYKQWLIFKGSKGIFGIAHVIPI
jgi:hypothetical protein